MKNSKTLTLLKKKGLMFGREREQIEDVPSEMRDCSNE